ncbi:hypothetical protein PIB30_082403 [Stylosanthes scabra]|uniref:Uncharacterized protein n=1 Tax=Stylosanthes scabra TaxID=79078 RepID=A0ABU6WQ84_9FABA|nr:hypothetical protein [Stylosanthes scabra]
MAPLHFTPPQILIIVGRRSPPPLGHPLCPLRRRCRSVLVSCTRAPRLCRVSPSHARTPLSLVSSERAPPFLALLIPVSSLSVVPHRLCLCLLPSAALQLRRNCKTATPSLSLQLHRVCNPAFSTRSCLYF